MSMVAEQQTVAVDDLHMVTFHVQDLLLALDIDLVQEINRHLALTSIPHAPNGVRGVINLRGEVVTVVDMRTILGLPSREITTDSRNVVINSQGESIGLIVDDVADILTIPKSEVDRPPANIDGIDGRFFKGVHTIENAIVVLLDVEEVLAQF